MLSLLLLSCLSGTAERHTRAAPRDAAPGADACGTPSSDDTAGGDTAPGETSACDPGTGQNRPPAGGLVTFGSPTWQLGDDLRCLLDTPPDDPDGDPLSHRIAWTVDGAPYEGRDGELPGDTVPAADISAGQTWTCTLWSDDGVVEVASDHPRRLLVLAEGPLQLQHVPAGTFTMGRSADAACSFDYQTPHQVTLTHGVWMGVTEVTQAQFEAVMGFNPAANDDCPTCPVERESWYEAAEFTARLGARFGVPGCHDCRARTEDELDTFYEEHAPIDDEFFYAGCRYVCEDLDDPYACTGYRLPTEAEWEYAARGGERYGSDADFTHGGDLETADCEQCPVNTEVSTAGTPLPELMWYGCSSGRQTRPVAGLAPNAVGLYDVHGNVYEWTNDYWDLGDYGGDEIDPVGGPGEDDPAHALKSLRGGSYDTPAYQTTLGNRWMDPMDSCFVARLGFRVAMTGAPAAD